MLRKIFLKIATRETSQQWVAGRFVTTFEQHVQSHHAYISTTGRSKNCHVAAIVAIFTSTNPTTTALSTATVTYATATLPKLFENKYFIKIHHQIK